MLHVSMPSGAKSRDKHGEWRESFGTESSGRIASRQVQAERAEARASLAVYFAVSGVVFALIAGWSMLEQVPARLIGMWLLLIAAGQWLACTTSRTAMDAGRPGRWAHTLSTVEALALAALWLSLPVWYFGQLSEGTQIIVAATIAATVVTAIGLAPFPIAAVAWALAFGGAAGFGYYSSAFAVDVRLLCVLVAFAAAAISGVVRLSRWSFRRLEVVAKMRSQAESIRMLLREYEHRGVGWLWHVDAEGRVVYISSRMTALLGRSTQQIVGHSLAAVLGGKNSLAQALMAQQPFANLEMQIQTPQGQRWISLSGDPIVGSDGEFQGFRGAGADVTDVRTTQERLINLANMDVLSGLPNRGHVRQLLGETLTEARQSGTPCAFMFLDLDDFKPVNDTFGHPKGDAVLKSVAERLVREVGDAGLVGRMGGDEFAIVIRSARHRAAVEELGNRLIAAIGQPYELDSAKVRIGVSIGCAFGPGDGESVDDLIQKADLALYQAKARGRATFCAFSRDMQKVAEDRMRLEQDLRQALTNRQFRLMYQPLINAATETLVGFEALIRWQHPTRGIVSPLDFIPLAEENGVIMKLGDWVIEEACSAIAQWPDHISVAVNVSPKQLVLPALPNAVSDALVRNRVQANRLELEVTESVFLGDTVGALDVLKRLRTIGVRIALDDFGTGYSSLGYLNKTVFHKLKIDGSFVREAATSKETVAIIQSIVQLAKSFRMTVTAEGVETIDDFRRMRELGCHLIQGYYFGRPMDFAAANEFVRQSVAKKLTA
jgi:diguanylate cyclase (GGDEF)-like protein/PAS domain S-box-containing protein